MQVEICQNLQSDKSELQDVWGLKIKQSHIQILLFGTSFVFSKWQLVGHPLDCEKQSQLGQSTGSTPLLILGFTNT